MLIKLTVGKTDPSQIKIPMDYQSMLQGFLYHCIENPDFAKFLHEDGYQVKKRKFKLFSFSMILEKPLAINRQERRLTFGNTLSFFISSVENEFFQAIFESIYAAETVLRIGSNEVKIVGLQLFSPPHGTEQVVEALSPIVAHRTAMFLDGKKRTIYYHPREKEFGSLLQSNLLHKYSSYYGKEAKNKEFTVKLISSPREVITYYKGFMIKGYLGRFLLSGSPELIKMAFEAGVGSKNSQGHGLIVPQELATGVC